LTDHHIGETPVTHGVQHEFDFGPGAATAALEVVPAGQCQPERGRFAIQPKNSIV
jgi:hypothetical protein